MFKYFIVATAVASLAVVTTTPFSAEARSLKDIKASGTLRVGFTGDYAPFSLRGKDGQIDGADVVMANSLARTLHTKLEIVPTTWTRMQADFQANRFDIVMGGVSITPDRAALGDFSNVVMHDGKRPIVRCGDKDRYTSIAAINRTSVSVVANAGGTNERFSDANFTRARLHKVKDNQIVFRELIDRRADVFVTDGAEVEYQARLHRGVLCPARVSAPFDHVDKAYWLTRDTALKQAVDDWLNPVLRSGTYARYVAQMGRAAD